ncbi:MAG: type II toxin-antitoxin system death-on-curing family toxin [Mycoplasma sp.]
MKKILQKINSSFLLDEDYQKQIINIVKESHIFISLEENNDKTTDQFFGQKIENGVESTIDSIINRFCYEDDFLLANFVSLIFIRLIKNHCFHNGNKRTALVSLLKILELYNIGLDLSKTKEIENLIINVAATNDEKINLENVTKMLIENEINSLTNEKELKYLLLILSTQ